MVHISVVILTYNSAQYIGECLKSVTAPYDEELIDKKIEILICDNNSTDKTIQKARKAVDRNHFDSVSFVENQENLGFAQGINKAVEAAHGKYIILINPDATLQDAQLFEMVDHLTTPKVKIVGGKIISPNNVPELSAGRFYTLPWLFFLIIGLEDAIKIRYSPSSIREVDFVSGGFMAFEKDFFLKLGGFDPMYFMYMEDMDLCFRTRKKGYKTLFFPYATIKHYGQGSSDRSFAIVQIFRGIKLFYKKNMPVWQMLIASSMLQVKAYVGIGLGKIVSNKTLISTYKRALKA